MTNQPLVRRFTMSLAVVLAVAVAVLSLSASPKAGTAEQSRAKFDNEGHLLRPDGWRDWTYVGTPVTPNDLNPPAAPFPEFHNVYIDPGSYAHYKKTGTFREGTVLVKELVSVGSKAAASGKGYFMGGFAGLEAAVKSAERFPNEPGNWGYFTFSHEPPPYPATAKFQPTANCNVCHQTSAADDWVFTQYYPRLGAEKGE